MLSAIRKLFRATDSAPAAAIPAGQRIYAVGDVHGRADLFTALCEAIDADDAGREQAESTVVLLGDLIDRGPDSAGVIAAARAWQQRRRLRILMGNHEEMFLDSLEDIEVLRPFLRFGGRETVLSYGIDRGAYVAAELPECLEMIRAAVPPEDLAFIRSFEDTVQLGDYLFVHAGVRPGVPLADQTRQDLRWIREPFLSHPESHGLVVVHGHTIFEAPDIRHNRIGIDTGAWTSGRLTALGLEGTRRWLIEAEESEGAIRTAQRSI